jgi:hypothetical protein
MLKYRQHSREVQSGPFVTEGGGGNWRPFLLPLKKRGFAHLKQFIRSTDKKKGSCKMWINWPFPSDFGADIFPPFRAVAIENARKRRKESADKEMSRKRLPDSGFCY